MKLIFYEGRSYGVCRYYAEDEFTKKFISVFRKGEVKSISLRQLAILEELGFKVILNSR